MADEIVDGYPTLCVDRLRVEAEAEALAASTKPFQPTPSPDVADAALTPEQQLRNAGFRQLHASPMWVNKDGQYYPNGDYAYSEFQRKKDIEARLPSLRFFIPELNAWYIASPEETI
jgi:hypothetical protein